MLEKRNKAIDSYKGGLVIFMILAHVIQFFCTSGLFSNLLSTYINLTTFSGFFFIFGFTNQIAYFNKEDIKQTRNKIFNNAIKILVIYYISAFSYRFFITNGFTFDCKNSIKIFLLFDIPDYSEFLLSFFLISILSFIFFNYFKKITGRYVLVISIFCLLATFVPTEKIQINQIGLIIGSHKFSAFPIIQYLPFYLIGIIFSKYEIKYSLKIIIFSFLLSISYFLYIIISKSFPSRFPPNIFFLFGSTFFLYVYFIVLDKIYATSNLLIKSVYYLEEIGRSTLFYLIFSNVAIFSIASQLNETKLPFLFCVILSFIILFVSYIMTKIIK